MPLSVDYAIWSYCFDYPLNLRERRRIEDMLNAKITVREIAEEIGGHLSTDYREIKRNHYDDKDLSELNGYYGLVAQDAANERRAVAQTGATSA